MGLIDFVQGAMRIAQTPAKSVDAGLIHKLAELAGLSTSSGATDLIVDTIHSETDVIGTLGDWLGQPGNPQRVMQMFMGGDGAPQSCRCPSCGVSFML